jgi:asparagine synthase (glutamine-hydrolysing)
MCGITGFLGGTGKDMNASINSMTKTLVHRGPDNSGVWLDMESAIAFGHRRLAIVDLSPTGHQPMASPSLRYVITFNGEIYNHLDLRKMLECGGGTRWRGHSDTETLLAGFDVWGIQGTLERVNGMFAFAVWDKLTRVLTLGRDRMGEKPLYYGWQGLGSDAVFLFGSELKALRAHPSFESEINRGALNLQLQHGCIPSPYSIYKGISKLNPGTLISVSSQQREPKIWVYWSGAQVAESGVACSFAGNAEQAVDTLEVLLKDAVRQQMIADVPLGAFLSGGVDSSTVVALMQAQSTRPVKTFTIGFNEEGYNEAAHARDVAKHLGTEHTELYVTAKQARDVIPLLPMLYDEPYSDSSQIPTFLISKLARQHVTVSLSGDAGDELFCGYNRYQITANLWSKLAAVPLPIRKLAARGLTSISPKLWDKTAGALVGFVPRSAQVANVGEKLHKGAAVLASQSANALYLGLVSHWQDTATVILDGQVLPTMLSGSMPALNGLDDVQRMMALDMLTYLPDDILTTVDRAAMGVSLETRVPFLDHRVVEFAWSLPQSMKLREGQSKWALRQVLYRHVPRALFERPKMGFGVPIDTWLRGPLRDWAEDLLSEARLKREGFFHFAPIRQKWSDHLSGRRNWQHHLWDVLMFQAWLSEQHE